MKDPHYRNALRFGWNMVWRHPYLWIYGLFAAVLGQMGIFDFLSVLSHGVTRGADMVQSLSYYLYTMPRVMYQGIMGGGIRLLPQGWIWMLWMFILVVGIFLHFVIAAVISQGALIHAAAQGKSVRGVATDGREWRAGVDHFWSIFFLNAGRKIVIVFLACLVGLAGFTAVRSTDPIDTIVFLVLFLFAALIGVIASFFIVYAAGYVVVEGFTLAKAIRSAWALFLDHWLVSLEIGVLFILFNVFVALLALVGFFIILLPSLLLWFFAIATVNHAVFTTAAIFFFVALSVYLCFLGAIFSVFTTSVWTHLFMVMHSHGVPSRIIHWLSRSSR